MLGHVRMKRVDGLEACFPKKLKPKNPILGEHTFELVLLRGRLKADLRREGRSIKRAPVPGSGRRVMLTNGKWGIERYVDMSNCRE